MIDSAAMITGRGIRRVMREFGLDTADIARLCKVDEAEIWRRLCADDGPVPEDDGEGVDVVFRSKRPRPTETQQGEQYVGNSDELPEYDPATGELIEPADEESQAKASEGNGATGEPAKVAADSVSGDASRASGGAGSAAPIHETHPPTDKAQKGEEAQEDLPASDGGTVGSAFPPRRSSGVRAAPPDSPRAKPGQSHRAGANSSLGRPLKSLADGRNPEPARGAEEPAGESAGARRVTTSPSPEGDVAQPEGGIAEGSRVIQRANTVRGIRAQVLNLFAEGHSPEAIADLLGMPRKGVSGIISEAKKRGDKRAASWPATPKPAARSGPEMRRTIEAGRASPANEGGRHDLAPKPPSSSSTRVASTDAAAVSAALPAGEACPATNSRSAPVAGPIPPGQRADGGERAVAPAALPAGIAFNGFWSRERVVRLIALWNKGKSASVCACELGAPSRSSVIAKVSRLREKGVDLRDAASAIRQQKPPRPRRRPRPAIVTHRELPEPDPAPTENVLTPRIEALLLPAEPPLADLKRKPIGLLELTGRTCRWPLGDPRQDNFGYCGAPCSADPSKPYCQHHTRIAYVPSSDRRRQPRDPNSASEQRRIAAIRRSKQLKALEGGMR